MVPVEVKLHTKSAFLEVIYNDGKTFELPAEYLRVYSPSAEVPGHSPAAIGVSAPKLMSDGGGGGRADGDGGRRGDGQ